LVLLLSGTTWFLFSKKQDDLPGSSPQNPIILPDKVYKIEELGI